MTPDQLMKSYEWDNHATVDELIRRWKSIRNEIGGSSIVVLDRGSYRVQQLMQPSRPLPKQEDELIGGGG